MNLPDEEKLDDASLRVDRVVLVLLEEEGRNANGDTWTAATIRGGQLQLHHQTGLAKVNGRLAVEVRHSDHVGELVLVLT